MKTPTKVPNLKPRNFVAKNALSSGAGKHKDKKKAEKQGDFKHKSREYAESAEIDAFKAAGGEIQQLPYKKPRAKDKTNYGSKHIGGVWDAKSGKVGKTLGHAASTNFKRNSPNAVVKNEGRFVKGAGGVPLDRYGNPKIPKTPQTTPTPQVRPDVTKPNISLDSLFQKATSIVGQIFPDGDPIDWLAPWCRKNSIPYEMVTKAFQKNGYKDIYDYWEQMKDDFPTDGPFMEHYDKKLQKSLTKEMKNPTPKKKFTDMELAVMEGGHSMDAPKLRKKKIKESYTDYLHNVLEETLNKNAGK